MSVDKVQTAHPAVKGPLSTRVTENIVTEVEMLEMIYVTKEDLKSVNSSLLYVFLSPKDTFLCPGVPSLKLP